MPTGYLRPVLIVTGVVTVLSCAWIVDTCGCTPVPLARITPNSVSVPVGDSVRVDAEGFPLRWMSRDVTIAAVSDSNHLWTFVVGVAPGSTVVVGEMQPGNVDSVLVTVVP